MHEGLLILSHASKDNSQEFLFCNKSAQKLITSFLGPIEECMTANSQRSLEIQQEIM